MAMDLPVAIITGDAPSTIPAASLPVTVNLDGSTSTMGTTDADGVVVAPPPVSIASYQWYLDKPPESAAVLINGTTATPSFVMDVPGTYTARLRVTNDQGVQSEGFTVRVHPDVAPYKFAAPATAYYKAKAALPVSGLVPPTAGARDYTADVRALFAYIETLGGSVASFVGSSFRTVWVQPFAGAVGADGSSGLPFNPTSAAANGYGGPIEQAVAALEAMDMTTAPETGLTLRFLGGTYTEGIVVANAKVPWHFIAHGHVAIAGASAVSTDTEANVLSAPNWSMGPAHGYETFFVATSLAVSNATDDPLLIHMQRVAVTTLTQGAAPEGIDIAAREFSVINAVTATDTGFSLAEDCYFNDDISVSHLAKSTRCRFAGNVTVAVASTSPEYGFYACGWGTTPVFTGPADSARFDPVTADRFYAAGGTCVGGCSTLDYICQDFCLYARAPVEMTGPQIDDEHFDLGGFIEVGVRPGSMLSIEGVFYAAVDGPSDGFRLGFALSNASGGQTIELIKQTDLLEEGAHTNIHVKASVMFRSVGDPCDVAYEGHSIHGDPPIVTMLSGYNQILDMEPAITRVRATMFLGEGAFGAASVARVLAMSVRHSRGLL